MRRAALLLCSLALLALASADTGSALSFPNPCSIVPSAVVGKAFGLASAPSGVKSTEPGGAAAKTLPLCTFTHGTTIMKITIGPKAEVNGGSGGAPGMVRVEPTGLGSTASEAYDHSASIQFTDVTFVKGPYWVSVWANGGVSTAKAVALAKSVYAAVA